MNTQIKTGLGTAVILIFAVTACYIVWMTQKNQPEIAQPMQIKISKIADETADWQTYRNEKYGFEVKLPGDWKAYSEYDGSVIASSPNKFPANPTILTGTPPTLDFQIGFIEDGKLNNSEGKSIKIKSGENGIETMNGDKMFFAVQLKSGLLSISSNKDYSQNDIIFSSISIIK